MGIGVGGNGNNQWEWDGNGNEALGIGGNGIKTSFPLISRLDRYTSMPTLHHSLAVTHTLMLYGLSFRPILTIVNSSE